MKFNTGVWILIIIFIILFVVGTILIGSSYERGIYIGRQLGWENSELTHCGEAVSHGYGEYIQTNDGRIEFRWIDTPPKTTIIPATNAITISTKTIILEPTNWNIPWFEE